jgi:hypothetical protein
MPSEVGLGIDSPIKITLSATDAKDTIQVNRTHPVVQGLAAHILSAALDPRLENKLRPARRAGVIRTAAVDKRTTLLLLRFRFHIIRKQAADEKSLLAEDCAIIGFKGSPENPEWLGVDEIDSLLAVRPDGNVSADIASERIAAIVDSYHSIIEPKVHELVQERATALLVNHQRVREASKIKGVQHEVRANLPADVLGIFHYLPSSQNG